MEFNELIDTHSQALMDEDLAELTKSAEEETEDPSQEDAGLTLERLAELMRTAKEQQEKAKSFDPYMVRSLQFSNAIDSSMSTYKTLFTTMKKQRSQLTVTMFLMKVKKNNQSTSKENTTPTPEEEELPENQCHHNHPHHMVQQISSSFIIGKYNKIKMFLIYHYYVHIIQHYDCF